MSANSPQKPTILIVDDEVHNVKLLETLLHAEGYATITARNGSEALALAAEKPDLILLDVMMPDMDGFETVARLKADPQTKQVPVIMVTALDDRDSKLRALEAGAEEFLSKPVDRADLTVRVRNLLRIKEYGDFLANHNRILDEQVKERTAQLEDAHRRFPGFLPSTRHSTSYHLLGQFLPANEKLQGSIRATEPNRLWVAAQMAAFACGPLDWLCTASIKGPTHQPHSPASQRRTSLQGTTS